MTTINVSTTAQLVSVLKTAAGGDVIQLAPGVYSGMSFKVAPTFQTNVTITSADPDHQAVLTDFTLSGAKGLTFTNLEFKALDHPDLIANDGSFVAFKFYNSSNLTFDKISVHGSLDGNSQNDVSGISVRGSNNITIMNSEFQQLERGVAIGQSTNIKITNNTVHDLRSDGFDFAEVKKVIVSDNTFRDFTPLKDDHPDAIQFWTTGTKTASTDINISGNVILKGDGAYSQGIFLRDQIGNLAYERVTISDNLIVGTGYNGIRVQGAKGLTLTDNELISFKGDNPTFLLIGASDSVVATGNKATSISFDNSTNVKQSGNLVTTAVTDFGEAAINKYMVGHGDEGGLLSTAVVVAKTIATQWAMDAAIEQAKDQLLIGSSAANVIDGFGGNDTIEARGGADTLSGGEGDDVFVVTNNQALIVEKAGQGVDTVIARGEHVLAANVENLIFNTDNDRGWKGVGNELNNKLTGNAGGNFLDGAAGNDTLDGGIGNDTLAGNLGSDRLTGGVGADVFRFAPGGGADVVIDFGAGQDQDTLDIAAYLKIGLKPTVVDMGHDAMIKFTNGDSITLLGVHGSDLGALSKTGWVF